MDSSKKIVARVLKPIPGYGYRIGETGSFDLENNDWLLTGKFIQPSEESVETATDKPKRTADVKQKQVRG